LQGWVGGSPEALKVTAEWLPSHNGLLRDAPHRHRVRRAALFRRSRTKRYVHQIDRRILLLESS
jgi:hypothetical protein